MISAGVFSFACVHFDLLDGRVARIEHEARSGAVRSLAD
jgi:hypothetical protein